MILDDHLKANRAIWFKNTLPVYCHVYQMPEKVLKKRLSNYLKNTMESITVRIDMVFFLKI